MYGSHGQIVGWRGKLEFHKDMNARGSKDKVLPKYVYSGIKRFLAMRGNVRHSEKCIKCSKEDCCK